MQHDDENANSGSPTLCQVIVLNKFPRPAGYTARQETHRNDREKNTKQNPPPYLTLTERPHFQQARLGSLPSITPSPRSSRARTNGP